MTEADLKTRLWFLKPGETVFFPTDQFSSGYLSRVIRLVEGESGHRFSSYTNLCGTMIRCNSLGDTNA